MGIRGFIFQFGLLWVKLLWTFISKYLCRFVFVWVNLWVQLLGCSKFNLTMLNSHQQWEYPESFLQPAFSAHTVMLLKWPARLYPRPLKTVPVGLVFPNRQDCIGLAKKFVWIFHRILCKNPSKLFGQLNGFKNLLLLLFFTPLILTWVVSSKSSLHTDTLASLNTLNLLKHFYFCLPHY